MDYDAVLAQVLELLQRELRLSYRVLKLRFQLDDETLEALKEDLVYAKQLAVDEAGGRVSKVEMTTPIALICKMLFPSISTFETPPFSAVRRYATSFVHQDHGPGPLPLDMRMTIA